MNIDESGNADVVLILSSPDQIEDIMALIYHAFDMHRGDNGV